MTVIESLQKRYSCKKFDPTKKLSEEKVEILKKAFCLTATSFGLQPIKLIVINNKKLQEKFVEASYFQRQVADASHLLIICIEKDTTAEDINAYFDLEKSVRGIGEDVVCKFIKQLVEMYSKMTIEEKNASAIYQCYIALGNLLTVCAVEEIDACPMEGFVPSKIDALLELNEMNLRSVLMLPVGYGAEDDVMKSLKKVRKPMNQSIIEIS